jgi:hypothetical protein
MTSSPDERAALDNLQVVTDRSALSWIRETITVSAQRQTIRAVVPNGFDAYVRILHPAYRHEENVTPGGQVGGRRYC